MLLMVGSAHGRWPLVYGITISSLIGKKTETKRLKAQKDNNLVQEDKPR